MSFHNEYIPPQEDKDVPCMWDDTQEGRATKRFSMGYSYPSASTANPSRYSQSAARSRLIDHEKYRSCLRKLEEEEEARRLEDAEEARLKSRPKRPRRHLFKVRPRPPPSSTALDNNWPPPLSAVQIGGPDESMKSAGQTHDTFSTPSLPIESPPPVVAAYDSNLIKPSSRSSSAALSDQPAACSGEASYEEAVQSTYPASTHVYTNDDETTPVTPSSAPSPTAMSDVTPPSSPSSSAALPQDQIEGGADRSPSTDPVSSNDGEASINTSLPDADTQQHQRMPISSTADTTGTTSKIRDDDDESPSDDPQASTASSRSDVSVGRSDDKRDERTVWRWIPTPLIVTEGSFGPDEPILRDLVPSSSQGSVVTIPPHPPVSLRPGIMSINQLADIHEVL